MIARLHHDVTYHGDSFGGVKDEHFEPFSELHVKDVVGISTKLSLDSVDQHLFELNMQEVDGFIAQLISEDVGRPIAQHDTDGPSRLKHNKSNFLTKQVHPEVAYAVGDTVMDGCFPFIVHIKRLFKSRVCNFCYLFKNNLVECECKIVFHCNELCRKGDLERGHEVECRSSCFRGYCQQGEQHERRQLVFKLYSLLAKDLGFWRKEFTLNDGSKRPFHDMILRPDSLHPMEPDLQIARDMAYHINACHPECRIVAEDIVFYDAVISAYSFPLFDQRYKAVFALGLYFEPSTLGHSCAPNTYFFNEGLKLHLRAIGPIAKDEQPTIGFLNTLKNFKERTSHLSRIYNLTCSCTLCKFEISGVDKVNYDMLGKLVRYFDKLSRLRHITQGWKNVYRLHKVIVMMYRQIYQEYDGRISRIICKTVGILFRMKAVPQHFLKTILSEALVHLRRAYGERHPYYVEFENDAKKVYALRFPEPQDA